MSTNKETSFLPQVATTVRFRVAVAVFSVVALTGMVLYMHFFYAHNTYAYTIVKGIPPGSIATFLALLCQLFPIFGASSSRASYFFLVASLAYILYTFGDIALAVNTFFANNTPFVIGACGFATGHAVYIVAIALAERNRRVRVPQLHLRQRSNYTGSEAGVKAHIRKDKRVRWVLGVLIVIVDQAAAVLCAILLYKSNRYGMVLPVLCYLYFSVHSVLGACVCVYLPRGAPLVVGYLAVVSYCVSDAILGINMAIGPIPHSSIGIMSTYWLALVGLSVPIFTAFFEKPTLPEETTAYTTN